LFNYNAFKSEYKKLLKKNTVFFKNIKGGTTVVVLFTFIIIFSLAGLVYYLLIKKLVPMEFFYMSIVALLGWFFALTTSLIYTKQNREINLIIQNNEIKKRLEIEAFKEVNKIIEEINLALAEIGTYYGHNLTKELSSNENTLFLDKLRNYAQINKQMQDKLLILWIKFKLKIRAYEIVLTQFNDLKNKIDLKFKKSVRITIEFGNNYTQRIKTQNSLTSNELLEFKNKCIKVDKSLSSLGKGLTGYGIELQNKILGEIFNSKIPN